MEPGRELDGKIAELRGRAAMHRPLPSEGGDGWVEGWHEADGRSFMRPLPRYSEDSDHQAQLELQQYLIIERGITIDELMEEPGGRWYCSLRQQRGRHTTWYWEGHGSTRAHALCLAALSTKIPTVEAS